MGCCTSCCSAIFLSLREWLLFLMPCAAALAEDAFIATGAVLETGGLLCSFSIALNRKRSSCQIKSRAQTPAAIKDGVPNSRCSLRRRIRPSPFQTVARTRGEQSRPNLAQRSMEEQSAEHTSGELPVLADSRVQSSHLEDSKSGGRKDSNAKNSRTHRHTGRLD